MITSWHIEYIFQDCEETFISIRVSLMCNPPWPPGLPTDIQILNKSRFTSTIHNSAKETGHKWMSRIVCCRAKARQQLRMCAETYYLLRMCAELFYYPCAETIQWSVCPIVSSSMSHPDTHSYRHIWLTFVYS
jgi:hypothetical protein